MSRAYPFVAFNSHSTIDHASHPRRDAPSTGWIQSLSWSNQDKCMMRRRKKASWREKWSLILTRVSACDALTHLSEERDATGQHQLAKVILQRIVILLQEPRRTVCHLRRRGEQDRAGSDHTFLLIVIVAHSSSRSGRIGGLATNVPNRVSLSEANQIPPIHLLPVFGQKPVNIS